MPSNSGDAPHYTVLGAGIVGASCALALRRAGFGVTLIDRDEPGAGASYGNAGLIQTGTPLPMATPGILRALPSLLSDPKSPLVIGWRRLPRLLPFLLRTLREARPERVEAVSEAMQALLDRAGDAHRELARAAKAEAFFGSRGLVFVYPDDDAYRAADWEMALYQRRGVRVEALDADMLRQMEPSLDRRYQAAYHLPDTYFTVDPGGLTRAYAEQAVALGGEYVRDDVRDVEIGADGPQALICQGGRRQLDRLVVAMGAHSAPIARRLGVRAPLESGRGYHLMLTEPGVMPNGPVVEGAMHVGMVPMRAGLRLAGTIELAGLDAPPDWRRADMLRPMAERMLPGVRTEPAERWMGHRPMLPDSLPIVGRAPRHPDVLLAFGHGQLGLTMGAVTGRIVADLAAGREPEVDLAPYRPDRF